MSMLDAHIPQLVAAESEFGTKTALMRHTIGQAEQAAMSAQAFHQGESAAAFQAAHARFVEVAARVNTLDRKSTRLNSSHLVISYAVFCLKKKKYNIL